MSRAPVIALAAALALGVLSACTSGVENMSREGEGTDAGRYPWHTDIPSTTFWVGEILDPNAADGSQMISAYDSEWFEAYGGCDGVWIDRDGTRVCETERRTAADDYFPTSMTPKQNPFYLDLPFDDVGDPAAFAMRGDVIPWADEYTPEEIADPSISLMKNRWVVIRRAGRTCYAQIQDAGPAQYADAAYVFGDDDRRPLNRRFDGAGLDVSPAVNGCLDFADLNGSSDRVDWAFIDADDVPDGPWKRIVTTSGVR